MKRTICSAACLVVCVFVLAGCAAQESLLTRVSATPAATATPAPAQPSTITICLGGVPESLDPMLITDGDTLSYAYHMYEGLFRYTADGKNVEYGCAESYAVSSDGLVWTVRIRQDASWADGAPVTAQDFVYAFRRVCDPKNGAMYGIDVAEQLENGVEVFSGELAPEKLSVRAVEDKTLEIRLSRPCGWLDEVLAFPVLSPIRQDMATRADFMQTKEGAVGNGPYGLLSYSKQEGLVLEKLDAALDGPDRLHFVFDEDTAQVGLRSGAVQFQLGASVEGDGLQTAFFTRHGSCYLVFNQNAEPFSSLEARKAFANAANPVAAAEAIGRVDVPVQPAYALFGEGFTSFSGVDYYLEGGPYMDTVPQRRQAAALEAWESAKPQLDEDDPITLLCYKDKKQEALYESLSQDFAQVLGVEIGVEVVEWDEYVFRFVNGEYDMAFWFWALDYNTPIFGLELFAPTNPYNSGGFADEGYVELIEEARRLGIHSLKGRNAMHKAESLIFAQQAVAPLYHHQSMYTASDKLSGYAITASQICIFTGARLTS